jgi:hypothetical protein
MSFRTELISVATAVPAPTSLEFEAGLFSAPSGTAQEIREGIILIESDARRPVSLLLRSASFLNGWDVVGNDRSILEKEMKDAGWVLFFMAGEIKATVFGFDEQKALPAALKRLAGKVKAQNCNSFEIMNITRSSFLGTSRVSVSAHARHLQTGLVCFGQ